MYHSAAYNTPTEIACTSELAIAWHLRKALCVSAECLPPILSAPLGS